jgi:transcriptional regulator with XRE-family HTH domain
MSDRKLQLGRLIKALREQRGLTQEELVKQFGLENRSILAHLEQGLRLPAAETLQKICINLAVPKPYWDCFIDEGWAQVASFEESLTELTGLQIDLSRLDETGRFVARDAILSLFRSSLTSAQALHSLNSILVFYDVKPPVSEVFFTRYLGSHVFRNTTAFADAVYKYQTDAIRLFNSFNRAYEYLNSIVDLDDKLKVLTKKKDEDYTERADWNGIELIETSKLRNLGYIAAAAIKQEENERLAVTNFLKDLANTIESDGKEKALDNYSERKKREMDSLLRKFNTTLPHGVFSPLFITDADRLHREAAFLAPRNDDDLRDIENTQLRGSRNLARYVAADYLDIYVATSMRTESDFISVNEFVTRLFVSPELSKLKLRYFNPTQSWIQDRVAKGLVEALMLRRADFTIYMAQREDSFGKDSEASVALGQGKPVVVYVPKLNAPVVEVDSEKLGRLSREELIPLVRAEGTEDDAEIDETVDQTGLFCRVLEIRLRKASDAELTDIAHRHWADFGLTSEDERIQDEKLRATFRAWIDDMKVHGAKAIIPSELREDFLKMLVSTTSNFEKRAKVFREQHPLALQVILQSGVLNGMLVVRSVESCALLLRALILNDLDLELLVDADNYRLVERNTKSTIRVISRNPLINSAFATFYSISATN